MEDLILKCSSGDLTQLTVQSFLKTHGVVTIVTCDQDGSTITDLTPSQTRELIEHLTNCLKEVENG